MRNVSNDMRRGLDHHNTFAKINIGLRNIIHIYIYIYNKKRRLSCFEKFLLRLLYVRVLTEIISKYGRSTNNPICPTTAPISNDKKGRFFKLFILALVEHCHFSFNRKVRKFLLLTTIVSRGECWASEMQSY